MGRQGLPWGHNVGLDCVGLVMRAVVAAAQEHGATGTTPVEVLAALRTWKNTFQ